MPLASPVNNRIKAANKYIGENKNCLFISEKHPLQCITGVFLTHKCLPDQEGIDTGVLHTFDIAGRPDTAFRDQQLITG